MEKAATLATKHTAKLPKAHGDRQPALLCAGNKRPSESLFKPSTNRSLSVLLPYVSINVWTSARLMERAHDISRTPEPVMLFRLMPNV